MSAWPVPLQLPLRMAHCLSTMCGACTRAEGQQGVNAHMGAHSKWHHWATMHDSQILMPD
eukprot:976621-Pelagomonas_calceolata.AAC.2